MIWLHAFHVVFVVTWFAALFYLPRLFVYAALHSKDDALPVLLTMQRKLAVMMHIGGGLAVGLGLVMLFVAPAYLSMGWVHAKLALVAGLIGYHVWCARLVAVFRRGGNRRSHTWYRWFNELPTLFLIAIVVLAVVKPF